MDSLFFGNRFQRGAGGLVLVESFLPCRRGVPFFNSPPPRGVSIAAEHPASGTLSAYSMAKVHDTL